LFVRCSGKNGSVYIIAQDNQVRRVLEMVGINRLIKTYDTENDFLREHQEIAVFS